MNTIELKGRLDQNPFYSFNGGYDRYYKVYINVARMTGYEDVIPCYVHEFLKDRFVKDSFVHITGELRTRKCKNGRELMYVDIKTAKALDHEEYYNHVEFVEECYIVKEANLRKTLNGEVADMIVASNGHINNVNGHNETAYIPIIVWDKAARVVSKHYNIGTKIVGKGTFHSRTYNKFFDDDTVEERIFNEISIKRIRNIEG